VNGKLLPRIDRLFELHKKNWFLRKEVKKSVLYWEWLQQPHEFPIYMQHKYKNIPASVRYPYEGVSEMLFKNLRRTVKGKELCQRFFTSTFMFMMGLAIYENVPRIEIYGVDMENDTEYGYQLPGGNWIIGFAVGRGQEVILPEPSELCRSPVYGYDVVPYVDKAKVEEIRLLYQAEWQKLDEELYALIKNFDPNDEEAKKKYMELSAITHITQGAMKACEKLLLRSDNIISRQYVDMDQTDYLNALEYWKAYTNQCRVNFDLALKDGYTNEKINKLWVDYQNARAQMYGNSGGYQVIKTLMKLIDFRPVDFQLNVMIKET
jgi:hypothetical protein